MFLLKVLDKIVFSPLIAVNEMLTSHVIIVTICQLTYHPCFDTQFRDGQTTQQYFRAVAMSSRRKRKRSSCFCPKRAVKRKKGNRFDKDWTDKHAASDKGSYD